MFEIIRPSAHAKPQEATVTMCTSKGVSIFNYLHVSATALQCMGIALSKGAHSYVCFSYVSERRRIYIAACKATHPGAVKVGVNKRIINAAISSQFALTYGDTKTRLYLSIKPVAHEGLSWHELTPKSTAQ